MNTRETLFGINNDTQTTRNWQARYAALIQDGTANSTRRAYRQDVQRFWCWANTRFGVQEHNPVAPEWVIQFVLDHLPGGESQTLIRSVLCAVISPAFRWRTWNADSRHR